MISVLQIAQLLIPCSINFMQILYEKFQMSNLMSFSYVRNIIPRSRKRLDLENGFNVQDRQQDRTTERVTSGHI